MRKLIFIPLLFIGLFIHAQTITWNGGTGKWHDPDNWTPNQVPNINDRVEIDVPGSEVYIFEGISAVAQHIDISLDNQLHIEGDLSVVAVASAGVTVGINNDGYISNAGSLSIQSASSVNSGTGYRGNNNSVLYNEASGSLVLSGFSQGILLLTTSSSANQATFYNEGLVEFSDLSSQAIFIADGYVENNDGTFQFENLGHGILASDPDSKVINSGQLNFLSDISNRAIEINQARLENQAGGIIDVQSGHTFISSIGIFNNGTIENEGHIGISSGRVLSITGAFFNNLPGSSIYINASTGSGAIVINGGELVNEGLIETQTTSNFSAIQVSNQGFLRNLVGGKIQAKGSGNGAVLIDGSHFVNAGLLRVYHGIGPSAINLRGSNPTVHNNSCGLMDFLSGEIQLATTSGSIFNEAVIYLKDPNANHVIDGQLTNTDIITDPYDRLGNININNLGLITNSLQGPLTAGTAIPNALRLGGTVNINSISWRTRRGSPSAGAYNLNTNVYTPNNNAVGDGLLWIRVNLSGCGIRWLRIPVQNPTPLQATEPNITPNDQIGLDPVLSREDWRVYPNPALKDVTITYPGSQNKDLTLELWNTTGQLISRQHLSAEAGNRLTIERPYSAKAGTYRLRITADGMEPVVKTIVWH